MRKHDLPGLLIAFCGADGTGKSTAIALLAEALAAKGVGDADIVHLRQPSDWWRSDPHVRSTIFLEGNAALADEFALGVFGVADRMNQQARVVEPALAAGRIVVMDRYLHCLLAYFMARREQRVDYLARACEPLFEPDLTFVLDCPPQVAVDRVVERDGPNADRYDQQLGLTTATIEAYRSLAMSNGLHLVSSVEAPEAIVAEAFGEITRRAATRVRGRRPVP